MSATFYCLMGETVVGPLAAAEIRGRPDFSPQTLVIPSDSRNSADWKPAKDVAEFSAAGGGPLILIVDDEQDLCDLLDFSARKAGFRTAVANSGREATKRIAEEPPSLIVLDLMMPGQNGFEFLLDLQAAGSGHIPVSIISARKMESSTLALICEEPNVVDFVAKPFDIPRLIAGFRKRLDFADAPARAK
jgi:CheY-like chemotaxis protein